jgi:hypothetical protein
MDPVTHGLASFAVARAFFPRAPGAVTLLAIIGGTIADIDWLSTYWGPESFLSWRGAYLHSVFAVFILLAGIPSVRVAWIHLRRDRSFVPRQGEVGGQRFLAGASAATACTALLHIAMDACQSDGVALFCPFSNKRIAFDWLPSIDPWILAILIAAIALPELLHLVSSEIGAKPKKPRGQIGAIIGLALMVVYIGVRATLHSNVLAMLQSRTFHGETPRRAAAFPETLSLFTWHGIVETERALDEITVDVTAGSSFDPDSSLRNYKPESSPALDAARKTEAAAKFLSFARFPKASVEKTEAGFTVTLRDLRYVATGETQHEIAAVIELDPAAKVTSQELIWARDLHH